MMLRAECSRSIFAETPRSIVEGARLLRNVRSVRSVRSVSDEHAKSVQVPRMRNEKKILFFNRDLCALRHCNRNTVRDVFFALKRQAIHTHTHTEKRFTRLLGRETSTRQSRDTSSRIETECGICYSIAVIRNSSICTSRSRKRSDDKSDTRITFGVAPSGCRLGGGVSWCVASWDRIGLKRKRKSGPLRRRNMFRFERSTIAAR